ncbi:tRNA-splicing endonuclease subunit sen54-like [Plakobranchus ocellatus]|uniref:tRNA-splicing endonuclease subunit sen54-like n=1 Tax=Plakobranchus ocellatus TaxID=259542 RepID=A0AAV4A3U9_9GAST|nr:tRNA-splicing endonuclease subunit sen54-like [Plakobranchus ocellatus]
MEQCHCDDQTYRSFPNNVCVRVCVVEGGSGQLALLGETILDRLNIIQSADNETLVPNLDCVVDLKISFCVHLPQSRFKKSMPGTPNHRVCVVKCSSELPNLAEVQEVWSRFKDGVPLHCAVVDSGEIAFYIFDNTFKLDCLP